MNVDDESRDPLDLLAEEFLGEVRRGGSRDVAAFCARHPGQDGLRDLLETLLLLEGERAERESGSGGLARLKVDVKERLGEYRIVREVGRGGMGVVFEAIQEPLSRRVALKVLPAASLLRGNQLERFLREARTAAALHHTNIVPVLHSGEADGLHYYAMQFIDGQSLDKAIQGWRGDAAERQARREAARATRVAEIGVAAAEALAYAHGHGLLHRDVKPANLLLDGEGRVWLTDFGLAKAFAQDGLTATGDVLGTPQYMAPEQLRGIYDEQSEVYSLGVTLYEAIALRPAFAGEDRGELLDKIRNGSCPRLERLCPAVPKDLATILQRAMATDPRDRYRSAAEFGADLAALLADRPIQARRHSLVQRILSWGRRNRAIAASLAVAGFAAAGAAVVGWSAYWVTADALEQARRSALAQEAASLRDRANLRDTLDAFEDVFDTLVGPDPLHQVLAEDDADGEAVAALRTPLSDEELRLLVRMLEFYDRFAARNEDSQELREQTARSYARVGAIQARLGRMDPAVAAYEKAIALTRQCVGREIGQDLAGLLQQLGEVQVRRGQPEAAVALFSQSLDLLEREAIQGSASARYLLARAHFLLATAPAFRGGPGGPMAGGQGGPPEGPPGPSGRRPGLRTREQGPGGLDRNGPGPLAKLLQERRQHLAAAAQGLQKLLAEDPQDVDFRFLSLRVRLESLRPTQRQQPPDVQALSDTIAELGRLANEHPEREDILFVQCEAAVASFRQRGGRGTPAQVDEAVLLCRRLAERAPDHPEYSALLARGLALQATRVRDARGRREPGAGAAELKEAVALLDNARRQRPEEARFLVEQLATLRRLVRAEFEAGDLDAAREDAKKLVELAKGPGREIPWRLRPEDRAEDLAGYFDKLGLADLWKDLRSIEDSRRR